MPVIRHNRAGPRTRDHRSSSTLRDKGVVTIPQDIREQLHLETGDELLVTVEDGRIVLAPATLIPRDQAWFWTKEWQTMEGEADLDKEAGRVERYATDEDFLASFEE
jgi:AbrB family looped-hinge helix DNA binding protein